MSKGNKAMLVNRLGVPLQNVPTPDIVIVDAQQLMYHISWPRLAIYQFLVAAWNIVSQDTQLNVTGFLSGNTMLSLPASMREWGVLKKDPPPITWRSTAQLPSRDAIMTNKYNKRQLWQVMPSFDFVPKAELESRDAGPRLNIKTVLSTYGDFHVKDKTAVRMSYL